MCQSIVHRGPDEQGSIVIDSVALGMRRLSVIDLATGQQPMPNESESAWIVFNGEIYNFRELRNTLLRKGHRFRTKSDTEVIVRLYDEYGVDCLRFLDGMFACAIWDRERERDWTDRANRSALMTLDGTQSVTLATFEKEVKEDRDSAAAHAGLHYEPIYESLPHHIRVYRNNRALPRADVVHEIDIARSGDDCIRKLVAQSFDPHRQVVIETNEQLELPELGLSHSTVGANDAVQFISDRPNDVYLNVNAAQPGMVVLADSFYPGWEATVGGDRAEIYRANYLFRAVRVPAGSHRVEFKYRPLSLKVGVVLFLAFLPSVSAFLLWTRRKRRRGVRAG